MNAITELRWRGLVQDNSDEQEIEALSAGTVFYVGLDPTARSLHLGNYIPLKVSMHLAEAGLKPLILFGGATGFIGDPSGKNAERNLLDAEVIAANVQTQQEQVRTLFARRNIETEFVNNYDWTHRMSILEFLRDVGKHFPVNYMLGKEVVRSRLDAGGISFTEFSYMLLQAFDFYTLYNSHQCRLQFGGSDQWGNITAGLELIRRKGLDGAVAFSHPLITNSQGRKFGKSEDGALWLDPELTSPYHLHQYLLNVDDKDVVPYLRYFTFLSEAEISTAAQELADAPEGRKAQKLLADELTSLIHGPEATQDAIQSASVLFGGSIAGMNDEQLEDIFKDVPSSTCAKADLEQWTILDLIEKTGLVASRGDGKRSIKSGGIYLNNERINSPGLTLPESGALQRKLLVLRSGKKSYHLVRVTP